jgi:stage II sporulation protein D
MKRLRAPLVASVLLLLVACVTEVETRRPPPPPAPELVGEPTIRVQLVEGQKQVKIACGGPCQVIPNQGEPLFPDSIDETVVMGDESALGLKLGSKPLPGAQEIRFAPSPGATLKLEGKPYRGELVVKLDQKGIKAINHVRAEEYVAGVIGGEMPLKWPDAALKAQSVAARTYAIWHWKSSQALDHDVTADTRSQVYVGQASERAIALVQATEGRVLTWQGRMFEAYFFACCSGETASAEWVFGGPTVPPLSGAKCGFCVASPHMSWERKITQAELAKALAPFGVKGRIEHLETVPWGGGGYVREVLVRSEGGQVSVPGPKFRFAFTPALKSACFEVAADPTGEVLVVNGKGWGHGVGLCQWGAKGCAETGMDEDQILLRYYPGAQITKAY